MGEVIEPVSQALGSSQVFTQNNTQTQELEPSDDITLALFPKSQDEEVWGRLCPKVPFLKCVELKSANEYCFGREVNCAGVFLHKDFNDVFPLISRVHFRIVRRQICSGSEAAFLENCSRNGTFVSGKKVNKDQSVLLAHNDVISLCVPSCQIYVYLEENFARKCEIANEVRQEFAVCEKLGEGAEGNVYLCYQKESAKPRALKQIFKRNNNNNVLHEVNILSKLKHRHIVQMMGHINTYSSVFIVMELMAGDLKWLLAQRHHLREIDAKIVFHQCLEAVEYLHRNRIIHRDLKPANILLLSCNSLYVKISDFGLSKCNITMSAPDTVCGTPAYISPEVLRATDSRPYDAQVDVWSMGVILFLCLSGIEPFRTKQSLPMQQLICRGIFNFDEPIWTTISKEAKVLIRSMLTVNPKERISIPSIFSHQWICQDVTLEENLRQIQLLGNDESP